MADAKEQKLNVSLDLKWAHGNIYDAKVSVTITDSCYVPGDLKIGLPPGTVGIPEIEYLTFYFTYKPDGCLDVVKTVDKSIQLTFSPVKPKATAFAVVNGTVAGEDTKEFPRK